jgi:hypothetical protein
VRRPDDPQDESSRQCLWRCCENPIKVQVELATLEPQQYSDREWPDRQCSLLQTQEARLLRYLDKVNWLSYFSNLDLPSTVHNHAAMVAATTPEHCNLSGSHAMSRS